MAISRKLRFEVFKHDNFTCQYCGKATPNVILEIDHILPVAEGGDDDIQNLITSCFDCNRGKGKIPLTLTKTRVDLEEDLLTLAEKELQLKEYKKLQIRIHQRENKDLKKIERTINTLCETPDAGPTEFCRESFRRFLKIFPIDRIIEALHIAFVGVHHKDPENIIHYCYGILHNWRRDKER